MLAHLHGCRQYSGRVDISVPVNLSELQKFGAFQSGNHAQHAGLFTITEMILKADHAVSISHEVFLAQLHGGVRFTAGSRIKEAHRFHRTIPQSINPTTGQLFNGQTGFEPASLFKTLQWNTIGFGERLMEAGVFSLIQRAVQIVVSAFAVTRGAKSD